MRALARELFDADHYRSLYPDVAAQEIDPFAHYLSHGWAEGRNPHPMFDTERYLSRYPDVEDSGANPFLHYLSDGWREGRDPSDQFDTTFYLKSNPDVAASGQHPFVHYLRSGRAEGRDALPPTGRRATGRGAGEASSKAASLIPGLEKSGGSRRDSASRGAADPGLLDAMEELSKQVETKAVDELPRRLRSRIEDVSRRSPVKVSVVMPTWNRRSTIDRAIDSVFAQSYGNFELIVVDDGSDDGTYEHVASKHSAAIREQRLKIVKGDREGVSAARNAGLRASRGEVIAYLDSDNAWRTHVLALYVAVLDAVPSADSVYTPIEVNDDDASDKKIVGRPYDRAALLRSNYIDLNGFAHRAVSILESGDFSVRLKRLVDWELILRLTKHKDPIYIPCVSTDYYLGKSLGNITKTEPIEPNFDAIVRLHRHEYLAEGVVSREHAVRIWLEDRFDDAETLRLYRSAIPNARTPLKPSVTVVLDDAPGAADSAKYIVKRYGIVDRVLLYDGIDLVDPAVPGELISVSEVRRAIVYWPSSPERMLGENALVAMVAAIVFNRIDVAVASHFGHHDGASDLIHAATGRDVVVAGGAAAASWLRAQRMPREATGRILRLETRHPEHRGRTRLLDEILGGTFKVEEDGQSFCSAGDEGERGVPRFTFDQNGLTIPPLSDPCAIVCGMKVAVGGVERLSTAIADQLRHCGYGALYLALEPTLDVQGSLTDEIDRSCDWLLELHEIVPRAEYLRVLQWLEERLHPFALYLMNGSMWVAANAQGIREVFDRTGIVNHQAYDAEVGWINRFDEPGIRSFDRFVAINRPIREAFSRRGLPDQCIDQIHHGIDVSNARSAVADVSVQEARKSFGFAADSIVATFAGRLTDQKRPLSFLELATKHREHDNAFLFLGDGVLRDECQSFIEAHDLDHVHHRPFVPNISLAFRASDVLVVTSDYEGLPLVVIEAMCVGLPILSTDVGEIREAVEQFGAGIIIPPNASAAELDQAFIEVRENLAELKEKAQSRREAALEHYSIENVARMFEASGIAAAQARPQSPLAEQVAS